MTSNLIPDTSRPKVLRLENVTHTYNGRHALDGVSLVVAEGKTTVLLGTSGSGKSTVLRAIVGLITPASGRISMGPTPITPKTAPSLRHQIGYVIQEGGLFPHLTGFENVSLMAKVLGWTAARIQRRVAELGELAHLSSEILRRYPGELSGGQRQRVSLMRALFLDPVILLLDEPLGSLDPIIRRELQDELREIFRALRKTVLLVTHDLREAAFFGDSIALMHEGRIVQRGNLRELIEAPAEPFVTEFVNAERRALP